MSKYLEPTLAALLSICSTSKYLHLSRCLSTQFLETREFDCLVYCGLRAGGGRAGELFVSLNFLDSLQSGSLGLCVTDTLWKGRGATHHLPRQLHCSHKAVALNIAPPPLGCSMLASMMAPPWWGSAAAVRILGRRRNAGNVAPGTQCH